MSTGISRRDAIKRAGVAAAGALIQGKIAARGIVQGGTAGGKKTLQIAGREIEWSVSAVSSRTVRITLQPIEADGQPRTIEYDGALVKQIWPAPRAKGRSLAGVETIRCGDVVPRDTVTRHHAFIVWIAQDRPGSHHGFAGRRHCPDLSAGPAKIYPRLFAPGPV